MYKINIFAGESVLLSIHTSSRISEIGVVSNRLGKHLWNLFFNAFLWVTGFCDCIVSVCQALLANICLTWQRCGNLKTDTFLEILWKCWVDGKGSSQCLNWKLFINWDGSRLSCRIPWLTCVNCVALNHLGLFREMLQGLWVHGDVTGEVLGAGGQPGVGPFCCLWKQSFLNWLRNSFAVYCKVLSHC